MDGSQRSYFGTAAPRLRARVWATILAAMTPFAVYLAWQMFGSEIAIVAMFSLILGFGAWTCPLWDPNWRDRDL